MFFFLSLFSEMFVYFSACTLPSLKDVGQDVLPSGHRDDARNVDSNHNPCDHVSLNKNVIYGKSKNVSPFLHQKF